MDNLTTILVFFIVCLLAIITYLALKKPREKSNIALEIFALVCLVGIVYFSSLGLIIYRYSNIDELQAQQKICAEKGMHLANAYDDFAHLEKGYIYCCGDFVGEDHLVYERCEGVKYAK